jgi:hypothetical protein
VVPITSVEVFVPANAPGGLWNSGRFGMGQNMLFEATVQEIQEALLSAGI